ncbi:MAG: hypothetical protein ACLFVW_02705 [Phycisphaerae bacterium]
MNDSPESPRRQGKRGDGPYLAIVAGLLILIMTLLATLWLRERSARIAAQEELTHCRRQIEQFRRILQLVPAGDEPRTAPADDGPVVPVAPSNETGADEQ